MSEHLRVPLQLAADGTFATVLEDSDDELLQNVRVVLTTRVGERLATLELGTDDTAFTQLEPSVLFEQVRRWEPRVSLELLSQAIEVLRAEGLYAQTTTVLVRREDS